jgi:hypothetical protein
MENNLFTVCASDNVIDQYRCCLKSCENSPSCVSKCARLFPETFQFKRECAKDCWKGRWVQQCIDHNIHTIVSCCEKKCNLNPFVNGRFVDCKTYCSEYRII